MPPPSPPLRVFFPLFPLYRLTFAACYACSQGRVRADEDEDRGRDADVGEVFGEPGPDRFQLV
jgi:hypothetical protein